MPSLVIPPPYLIVIGASTGGVSALIKILSDLPADFKAAVAIVQHQSPDYHSRLAALLNTHSHLSVKEAQEGDKLADHMVYVARPNKHLIVNANKTLSLLETAKVQFVRPSADRLFNSAALVFKDHLIGVVLTGKLQDGAAGVIEIKANGGVVIVQDEASSRAFSMPKAAIDTGCVDQIMPLDAIAKMLITLVA